MTKQELTHTTAITVVEALRKAFDAGCIYGICSHEDFVQIHQPREPVCEALARRIGETAAVAAIDWLRVQSVPDVAPGFVGIPAVEWDSVWRAYESAPLDPALDGDTV